MHAFSWGKIDSDHCRAGNSHHFTHRSHKNRFGGTKSRPLVAEVDGVLEDSAESFQKSESRPFIESRLLSFLMTEIYNFTITTEILSRSLSNFCRQ